MKTFFSYLTLLFVGLVMASCCACRQGSPKIGQLEEGKWRLIELNGKSVAVEKSVVLTFDKAKKMVYGNAPCNNFFASYSTFSNAEHNIEIKNAGATRMLCPDSEVEDTFVRQLCDIANVKVEDNGNKILLINKAGDLFAILSHE